MAGELILIVDDNEQNRKLARDVLAFAGFRTLEAARGAEGLSLAAEHRPDVVFMDLRMPALTGVEATTRITRDHPGTAVLVLTMSEDPTSLQAALRAGARGY